MDKKNLQLNKNDIFYCSSKKKNKKGVIIYVHGFSSTYYLHHQFFLANNFEEYDYFSINFKGHKISDTQTKLSEYDINQYANELINEIKKHHLTNIILIGHSMGGGIALLAYQKLASKIIKIILVNAINPAIYKSSIGLKYLLNVIKNKRSELKIIETYEKIKSDNPLKNTLEAYLNFELERFLVKKRKFLFLGFKLISPILYTKLVNIYKTITVPTLFISGKNDVVIPSNPTKRFIKKINNPYIKFVSILNTKHIPFVEDFDKYNEIVWNFINNN